MASGIFTFEAAMVPIKQELNLFVFVVDYFRSTMVIVSCCYLFPYMGHCLKCNFGEISNNLYHRLSITHIQLISRVNFLAKYFKNLKPQGTY